MCVFDMFTVLEIWLICFFAVLLIKEKEYRRREGFHSTFEGKEIKVRIKTCRKLN